MYRVGGCAALSDAIMDIGCDRTARRGWYTMAKSLTVRLQPRIMSIESIKLSCMVS